MHQESAAGRLAACLWILLLFGAAISGCDEVTKPTGGGDPQGVLSVEDFDTAGSCQSCHPDHFDQWSGSMHAYALLDPTFAALRQIGQSQYINALAGACVRCHSPIGARTGAIPWGPFNIDELPAITREGVGCDLCHTITAITALSNAGFVLTPGKTKFGSLKNPVANGVHKSEFHPLYPTSEYCGSCHDLITDDGLGLETVFGEWRAGGFALTGKTCNECHMPAYQGPAAVGGPTRTLHDHRFIGADVALIDFPNKAEQLQRVTDLLRSALTVDFDVPDSAVAGATLALQVRLTNDLTGHDVPSGVPFIRQIWLAVVVRDAAATVIYASGDLDANEDLKDANSAFPERDLDLFNTQATMLRADSTPTGLTWEARYLTNPSIKPNETRTVNYAVDVPAGTAGPLQVEIKVRFRSFPPYVMRALGTESLLPIPIIDMAETTRTVGVL